MVSAFTRRQGQPLCGRKLAPNCCVPRSPPGTALQLPAACRGKLLQTDLSAQASWANPPEPQALQYSGQVALRPHAGWACRPLEAALGAKAAAPWDFPGLPGVWGYRVPSILGVQVPLATMPVHSQRPVFVSVLAP